MTTNEAKRDVMQATEDAGRAAQAAWHEVAGSHARDWTKYPSTSCKCGRDFVTSQALGIHVSAAVKRGDKAWDKAYDAHIEAWRNER